MADNESVDHTADTVPFELGELERLLHEVGDDPATEVDEVEQARKRLPEPALVRGGILAVVNLAAVAFGITVDSQIVEALTYAYGVLGPIALALWIRSKVSPAK